MKISTIITVIRFIPAILAALPTAFALIGKIREVFGNEQIKEVIKAFGEFIDKIAPPVPATENTTNIPANPEREKRRRLFRFRNRIDVAGMMTDDEAQTLCDQYHTKNNRDHQYA